MTFTLITLIVVGIVLFILSFFAHDKVKDVENQMEQLSITTLQDTYKMKTRLKVLEEELLSGFIDQPIKPTYKKEAVSNENLDHPPLLREIKKFHELGYSTQEIAEKTSLDEHDVRALLYQINPKANFDREV